MYCFPYPRDSTVTPLRAPYIATYRYSLGGPYTFESFYETTFDTSDKLIRLLQRLEQSSSSAPDLCSVLTLLRPLSASAIQSWLFFGLAAEALGRDVMHHEFIEDCGSSTSEATIDIRIPVWFHSELKARWEELQNTLSKSDYNSRKQKLQRYCSLAALNIAFRDVGAEEEDTELSLILLSVHMLLYLTGDVFDSKELHRTGLTSKSTQLLMRRMLKNGWCRKRLNFIESNRMSYPAFYFMSSFRPPQSGHEDHQTCTPEKCYVRIELMEPFHRTVDCQCQDVQVPLEQVVSIVAAGGIPLIRIQPSLSGNLSLEVVPYMRTIPFTAISHVWADRQLGSAKNALPMCQVKYLDSMLATLPRGINHWCLRDWLPRKSSISDPIEPPSRVYEFFWLDTFCIPQDDQYADLRYKAIGSMNLVYAAAAQTLVFDSGLQRLDAGNRPSSLVMGGQPSFYAPTDKNLLDVLAHICASNWMGRAWTLQEGVLSGHLAFPLKRSLAYLRLLRPNHDAGFSLSHLPFLRRLSGLLNSDRVAERADHPLIHPGNDVEPLRDNVRHGLFIFAKASLKVEEHDNYARGSADRAARFIDSHSLLQSRTTTQPEDLVLILMNMSGMNGNIVSQSATSDEKMKLLYYGLGTIPIELLFSVCTRLRRCDVDSWMPKEIVPESFSGNYVLRLGSDGFTFQQQKAKQPIKFFLLSRSVIWQDQMLLSLSGRPDETDKTWLVKAASSSEKIAHVESNNGWCILIEDEEAPTPRAALFMISSIVGDKVFLNFDRPLRLFSIDHARPGTAEQLPSYTCFARPADSQHEFIIKKSSTFQSFSISRPQNPDQYSDRLVVISAALFYGIDYVERYIIKWIFGDILESNSTLLLIVWTVLLIKQREWMDQALDAFVHRAWTATYSPTWRPNGPWKWFWKVSNFEPPIPFMTMMKYYCHCIFFMSASAKLYFRMLQVSLYWYVGFPKQELINMYVTVLVAQGIVWFL